MVKRRGVVREAGRAKRFFADNNRARLSELIDRPQYWKGHIFDVLVEDEKTIAHAGAGCDLTAGGGDRMDQAISIDVIEVVTLRNIRSGVFEPCSDVRVFAVKIQHI